MTLADDVRALLGAGAGTFAAYARNLTTDEIVGFDRDRVCDTASAAKTFALVHYSRPVDAGACDPGQRLTMTLDDRVLGSGVLRYLTPGIAPTLDDLAFLMIIVSDNVATDMLVRAVGGPGVVNETMAELGLPTAAHERSLLAHPATGRLAAVRHVDTARSRDGLHAPRRTVPGDPVPPALRRRPSP